MRNISKALFLCLLTISKIYAQDSHFIPAPKALYGHELPFDEKNQTKLTLRSTEDLVIAGATKMYTLKYASTVVGANSDVECHLAYKSEIFERRIQAGQSYLLNLAPEKIKEALGSVKSQGTRFFVKPVQETEVPIEHITCNYIAKNGARFTSEAYMAVRAVNCLFEVRVKAPLGRTNPDLECKLFD